MPGRNRLHRSTTATTSTSTIFISSSGSDFATGPSVENPALLTSTSAVSPSSCDPVEQAGAGRPVREVGGQHVGAAALGPDLVASSLELVGGAGDQGDVVAAADELAGDLGADALGGAGDDGGPVGAGQGKAHARER